MECPICETNDCKLIGKVNTINITSDKKIDLNQCAKCKHWFHYQIPKQIELNEMYLNQSPFVTDSHEFTKTDKMVKGEYIYKYILKNYRDDKNINYLEIGIGSGSLFNEISKKFNCYGVDPIVKNKNNLFTDISLIPKNLKFDLIICQDVLEHLENPLEYLKNLYKLANKNAVIITSFPNKDSIQAQIKRKNWKMIRPIGHLHYFSKESSKLCFNNSGWKIKKLVKTNVYIDYLDLFINFRFKTILLELILGRDQLTIIGKKI